MLFSADNFYWYASIFIFIPWLMLIFLPNGKYSEGIAIGSAVVLLLAAAYFTFSYLFGKEEGGALSSVEGIPHIFRSKDMLKTALLNYLSFCLLVGVWQLNDSQQHKIPHIFVAPAMMVTMLMGPTGLLLYMLIRFFKTKKWAIK